MKRTVFTSCLLMMGSMIFAQNILEVKDNSQPNDVFSSANDEAAVVIHCHKSIPLHFSSTMDKTVEPFRTEVQGNDSVYYLSFPTGSRYRGRQLMISSSSYAFVTIDLELQPKQLLSFLVFDPNSTVDAGCYRTHRNKGIEEIKSSNYREARNHFILARECSDCDTTENNINIALTDSLILFRQKGDEAYELLDYVTASNFFAKVVSLNNLDDYATTLYNNCIRKFADDCSSLFSKAEYYYSEKEYDKAKELYEKVIARECRNQTLASERLNSMTTLERAKRDHARVFTYEFRKDVPFGFSYGKYNIHKVGGFFQMDFNSTVFDAIRSDCIYGDEKFPELNMAFGWTIKIAANIVWIHVGPGVTTKFYYGTYQSKKFPEVGYGETSLLDTNKMGNDLSIPKTSFSSDDYEDAWKKTNVAFAISPVIGVTAKYSYFAFRLTYQYRWAVQSKLEKFMGNSRLSVGVGVAF